MMNKKTLLKAVSASALALTMLAGASFASQNVSAAGSEQAASGVLTVRYNGRGKVRLLDGDGHWVSQYVAKNSSYKVFGVKQINGMTMYRIGSQKQWIPAIYSNRSTQMPVETTPATRPSSSAPTKGEQPYSGITIIIYHGRGQVRLLDANGNWMNQYVSNGSSWKVFGVKRINGQVMYRLGNQSQWVPAVYTNFPNSIKENNAAHNNKPAANGSISNQGSPAVKSSRSFAVFTSPISNAVTKYVSAGQTMPVSGRAYVNGQEWFRLADGSGWVKGADVAATGHSSIPVVNPFASQDNKGNKDQTTKPSTGNQGNTGSQTKPSDNTGNKGNVEKPHDNNADLPTSPSGDHGNTGSTTKPTNPSKGDDNKPVADSNPTFTYPAGYTNVKWGEGNGVKDTDVPQYASMLKQGFNSNNYVSNDSRPANTDNLTPAQQQELSAFALQTINAARASFGLTPWTANAQAQAIANKVATYYVQDHWTIAQGHDVNAIVKAANENGLPIKNNYLEDMGHFRHTPQTTMGYLKEQIYYDVKQMLFGGMADGNSQPHEMQHARALLDPQHSDFGFSISNWNGNGDAHFINITDNVRNIAKTFPQGF